MINELYKSKAVYVNKKIHLFCGKCVDYFLEMFDKWSYNLYGC